MADEPLFIALETTTNSTGKDNWAIWRRDPESRKYSHLVARVYDPEWCDRIVGLLNNNPTDV